jgi:hypothetical protein
MSAKYKCYMFSDTESCIRWLRDECSDCEWCDTIEEASQ